MNSVFFVVRLPFFLAGVIMLVVVAMLVCVLAPIPLVLLVTLVLPSWLVVLLPGAFVTAAFRNDPGVMRRFLDETTKIVRECAMQINESIRDYFGNYGELWRWLLTGSSERA